jgi:protein-L-isoaspartate(D-aspartate) O-methyltransferase
MISGSLPVLPEGLLEQLKVGGRLGVIVGDSPVMSAQVITRVSESAFNTLRLFETDVPPLRNAVRPSTFRF